MMIGQNTQQYRQEPSKDVSSLSMFNSKVQNLNDEYTAMLSSTLESQREYYQLAMQTL